MQSFQLLRCRPFVNTVQARLFVLPQKSRRADVGRQHALFDQAMRLVAFRGNDILNLALIVEQHHRLDRFEIDGTALRPRLEQYLEQRVERLQMRLQALMNLVVRLIGAG